MSSDRKRTIGVTGLSSEVATSSPSSPSATSSLPAGSTASSSAYAWDRGATTELSLLLEAAVAAIRDAGLTAADTDGVVGGGLLTGGIDPAGGVRTRAARSDLVGPRSAADHEPSGGRHERGLDRRLRGGAGLPLRVKINGRVPVNTHGGSLSEGGSQGAGHVREAVTQLQAGARCQVPGATAALLTPGGFFFNAQGLVLRTS